MGSCISCFFQVVVFSLLGGEELQARAPIVMGVARAAFGGRRQDHMGIVFDRAVWLAELDTGQ